MATKSEYDTATGYRKQNLFLVIFSAAFVFGGLSRFLSMFPTFSPLFADLGWILAIVGFISMLWRNYSPNLWVVGILYLDLIVLCMLCAIRSYGYIFPNTEWIWSIIITISVSTSYMITIVKPSFTKFLRTELMTPKTSIGKRVRVVGLLLGPLAGTIAALFGALSAHHNNNIVLAVLTGNLFWILAIFLPFGTLYPISPYENKK